MAGRIALSRELLARGRVPLQMEAMADHGPGLQVVRLRLAQRESDQAGRQQVVMGPGEDSVCLARRGSRGCHSITPSDQQLDDDDEQEDAQGPEGRTTADPSPGLTQPEVRTQAVP